MEIFISGKQASAAKFCPCTLQTSSWLVPPWTRRQRSWVVFQKQLHNSHREELTGPILICFQWRYVITSLLPLLSKTFLFLEYIYGSNYRMANQTALSLGHTMTFNSAQLCLVICLTVITIDTLGCRGTLLQSERKQAVLEVWHTSLYSYPGNIEKGKRLKQAQMYCSVLNPWPQSVRFFLIKKHLYLQ